jgi:hypothetical protein
MIDFHWFNDDLIPSKTVLDMNIGTNYDPFGPQDDRYRILVDPLFGVCDSNAKLTSNVTSFCFAVSDYTMETACPRHSPMSRAEPAMESLTF